MLEKKLLRRRRRTTGLHMWGLIGEPIP